MAETLVCRGCKNALSAEPSCALCELAKRNLLVEDDGDNESLAKVAGSSIRLLRGQLKRLEEAARKSPTGYDPSLGREIMRFSGAISKLLEASRKVIQDGVDAVESMSFQERAAIITEWFISLPPAYRRQLYGSWGRHVETNASGAEAQPLIRPIGALQ